MTAIAIVAFGLWPGVLLDFIDLTTTETLPVLQPAIDAAAAALEATAEVAADPGVSP